MIVRYLKAKILVFAVFFIGIATGVLIANFYTTHVAGVRLSGPSGDASRKRHTAATPASVQQKKKSSRC